MCGVRKIICFSLLALSAGLTKSYADGDGATRATLEIQLEIEQGCTIGFDDGAKGAAGAINFGSFINLDTTKSKTSQLFIRCSAGTKNGYTVSMDAGLHSDGGSYKARNLQSGSGAEARKIPYQIYRDRGCSQLWGDSGDDILKGTWTGTSDTESVPVCVVIPAQPGKALYPGRYTDQVKATIVMTAPGG